MIHPQVTMWWDLNPVGRWHPARSSWLAFSLWQAVVSKSCVSVIKCLVFVHSQRPVVLIPAFSYGSNMAKWSRSLLTLKLWEAFSDLFQGRKITKSSRELGEEKESLWEAKLCGLSFCTDLTPHSYHIFYTEFPCVTLFYFFNFTAIENIFASCVWEMAEKGKKVEETREKKGGGKEEERRDEGDTIS